MHFPNHFRHGVVLLQRFPPRSGCDILQLASPRYTRAHSRQTPKSVEGFYFPLQLRPKCKKQPADPPEGDVEAVTLTKRLSYLLRHGAEAEGLNIRPDGWVPLGDVLKHATMMGVSLEGLQKVLQRDPQRRIKLKEEPVSQNTSTWWIKASGRHSIPSVNTAVKQIKSVEQVSAVLYCVNWTKWDSIKQYGIWPEKDDSLIHFIQSVHENYGIEAHRNTSQVVIQLDLSKAILEGLQFFITNDHSIVTAGDYRGCVGPEYIYKASRIMWSTVALQKQQDIIDTIPSSMLTT
ncbi:tRNA 2'-phosphotransferase [Stygiomarasmius scandens]|uniref:2'-phosphotransferase n=1 Tax=Marasmiellus scandens TaxID=2682957 RepID=A0ABR1JXU9_9AGAR